jgi:hypothetical protein
VVDDVAVVEEPDGGVAVADVGAQQRGLGRRSIAMSSTGAEWVSAPTAL